MAVDIGAARTPRPCGIERLSRGEEWRREEGGGGEWLGTAE